MIVLLKSIKLQLSNLRLCLISGFTAVIFRGGEAVTYLRVWFMRGKKRWAELIVWVTSQRLNFNTFAVRWNLKWYKYFVGNCIIAVTATSFGFALGTVLTVVVYDDGLERVMDVYNYFKNPPRS